MYCFSGENEWFWEGYNVLCANAAEKELLLCAPLDSGNGRGYNTKVKSCAEEEYLFVRPAERGRLVRALAGEQRRSFPSSAPEL